MVVYEEYPIHLGLAYLFFVGYFVRTVFVGLRLPGAVGVIVSGFAFSYFMQVDIFEGRDMLQGLAFFLVLLTAGMEISLADLKPYIILCAIVPATLEMLGVAAYAHYVLEWTIVESAVLGVVLFGLGDGLVIPKMTEFGQQFPDHPLPRLVFIWAPLEASYALTLFGVVYGMSDPAGEESSGFGLLALANLLRLAATLGVGAAAGAAAGWLVSNRLAISKSWLPVPFSGTTVEAFLVLLAVALAGFGISSAENGPPLVPMGFASGSLFQPELMVIVIGSLFAQVVDPQVLHSVEVTMGGVWVFGQLILFSMLGSKTDVSVFAQIANVLPLLVVGLCLRFLGVLLVTVGTLRLRPCTCESCLKANMDSVLTDTVFCFLSTLPRATIQGALGQVPVTERFFHRDPSRRHVQMFISVSARLYIVCMSVIGSILLDAIGPKMLAASRRQQVRCIHAKKSLKDFAEQGWTEKERKLSISLAQQVPSLGKRSECKVTYMQSEGSEKLGPSTLRPRQSFEPRSTVSSKKGRSTGREGQPLLLVAPSLRRSSAFAGPNRRHSMDACSQVTATNSVRSRTSTWSAMHQLEGRMVEEEPPFYPSPGFPDEDGGEVWDNTCLEEDEEGEEEEQAVASGGEVPAIYVNGDFLPNTNIKGDPIEECNVPPL